MSSGSNAPRLSLDLIRDGQVLRSSSGAAMTLGRDPACDVHLPDRHISTRHGEIFFAGTGGLGAAAAPPSPPSALLGGAHLLPL